MRIRLAEQAPDYTGTRDNFASSDHAMRTMVTAGMMATIAPRTVLDPACGDASVLEVLYKLRPFDMGYLVDISQLQIDVITPSFPHEKRRGDLYDALDNSARVDFIVLTEVLEHLEEPERALRLARLRGDLLIASSPIGDPEDGRNHEHLWAWDEAGYGEMLESEGWVPFAKSILTYPGSPWNSQIWMAR
jgi:SAM-dependent methyltransferase